MDIQQYTDFETAIKKNEGLKVVFWGVRGSIACPGPDTLEFGGNTSCVEVRAGQQRLIFDAGTGIKALGDELVRIEPEAVDLFLSHTHIDHLNGFPFFKPAYRPGTTLRIHAGHLLPNNSVERIIRKLMDQPLFPVTVDVMRSTLEFHDFEAGASWDISDEVTIRTAPLNHPDGATGYRVEYEGGAVCYVTDTEHKEGEIDRNIVELAKGADILIYDSTYTDEEYPTFKGWGHSTWQEGIKIADAAGVDTFIAFHHDPEHDDEKMNQIEKEMEKARPGSVVAREGMTVTVI